MVVMKFGGTSVANAEALQRVLSIVTASAASGVSTVVVLSATAGTTNALLQLATRASAGESTEAALDEIEERHRSIVHALIGPQQTEALDSILLELRQYVRALYILRECTGESLDHMAAFGERLSSTIFHQACSATVSCAYLDARTVVVTNDVFTSASVDFEATVSKCNVAVKPLFKSNAVVVTQGFVGSTTDGRTTTLGRGGSDYSAALFGAALGAEEIDIWTDVSGVYSADPRMVPDAFPIPELSFEETRELALYGAKVLHPDTIAPAVEAGIPVRVLNTFRAEDPGTRITTESHSNVDIHAVSMIANCTRVDCSPTVVDHIRNVPQLASRIVLEAHSIEHSMIVLRTETSDAALDLDVAIAQDVSSTCSVSLLAVSGPAAAHPRVVAQLMTAAGNYLHTRVITGAAKHTTFVLVEKEKTTLALQAIHALIPRR